MNSYFAKIIERLIKDKLSFREYYADVLKELINFKKPENVHFNMPLLKPDELKSIFKSLDPRKSIGIEGITPKMLKIALDVLLPFLPQMMNISLHTVCFLMS